ncbi:hypothetical protein DSO57_1003752 [Entomophthora muscae]|uniref:Uncharacterized protein n=1 Tax=Entomophthora muscae TaxID=34485 RepID=A0ACC2TK05_9FUNG|nr:hypothetical protein DSO57_1003752 [Entomophthora muscae]
MKLLRQGEDALKLLEEENSGRKKSSLSRTHSFSSSMIYLHPSGSLGASAPYHHAMQSKWIGF